MKDLIVELKLRSVRVKESSANKQVFADAARTIERYKSAIRELIKDFDDRHMDYADLVSNINKLRELVDDQS